MLYSKPTRSRHTSHYEIAYWSPWTFFQIINKLALSHTNNFRLVQDETESWFECAEIETFGIFASRHCNVGYIGWIYSTKYPA